MTFVVSCTCGKQIEVSEEHIGRTGRCPGCRQPIKIEAPAGPESAQQYFARAPGAALQGPYQLSQLREWMANGQLDPALEFSADGHTWLRAAQIPGLAPTAPAPRVPPAPAPRAPSTRPRPAPRQAARKAARAPAHRPARARGRARPSSGSQNPPWLIPAALGGLVLAVVLVIAMSGGSEEQTPPSATKASKPKSSSPTNKPISTTPVAPAPKKVRKPRKVDHPSWKLAEAAYAKEDYEAAAAYFDAVADVRPKVPDVHLKRGICREHLEEWNEAVEAYEEAIKLERTWIEPSFRLGKLCVHILRWEDGGRALQRVVNLDEEHGEALSLLSICYRKLKRLKTALKMADRAVKLMPESAAAHFNRGGVLLAQEEPDGAIAAYRAALARDREFLRARCALAVAYGMKKQWDKAEHELDKVVTANGDYADAWYGLATVRVAQSDYEGAIEAFRRGMRGTPEGLETHRPMDADGRRISPPVEAKRAFEDAARKRRSDADAQYALGAVHIAAGEWKQARGPLQRALSIDRSHVKAINALGVAYRESGDDKRAIEMFNRATRIAPNDAEAHFNLGDLYWAKKRAKAAREEYEKALDLDRDHAGALRGLGEIHYHLKEYAEARRRFERSVALEPESIRAQLGLTQTYIKLKRLDEALAALTKIVHIAPKAARAHYLLGVVNEAFGNTDLAIGYYKEAVSLRFDYAEAHLALARLLEAASRYEEAVRAYGHVVRIVRTFAEGHYKIAYLSYRLGDRKTFERHKALLKQLDDKLWSKLVKETR